MDVAIQAGNYKRTALLHGPGVLVALLLSAASLGAEPMGTTRPPFEAPVSANSMLLAPAQLEESGALVGNIVILNRNIFDLDDPREDKTLFRLANRWHVKTRPRVIRQQLLFEPGQPFVARNLVESERLLRANRYLQDASVHPIARHDDKVDIAVETTDVWTLMPRFSFSRSGGTNRGSIGLREMNLLGSGTEVELMYRSEIDRQTRSFGYKDRNLNDSWYRVGLNLSDNSDGHAYSLEFGKPFYSLDSRDAFEISMHAFDQTDSYYELGEVRTEYRHSASTSSIIKGWSRGLNSGYATRYVAGLAYEDHQFDSRDESQYAPPVLPDDRRYVYPFVGIERVQDRYEKASNRDQIGVTEDRYLGTRFAARIGFASANFGSSKDALIIEGSGRIGYGSSARDSLILESSFSGRLEGGGLKSTMLEFGARYYRHQSPRRLLYVGLGASIGEQLDVDELLFLGGDNGLRGYPARYQVGQKRVVFTVEQRLFTDWYPFRLFRVGGAAFLDIGKIWGGNPYSSPELGLLKNVGIGLRLGNTRSGAGRMIHVDIAYPLDNRSQLDSPQFLISTQKSF